MTFHKCSIPRGLVLRGSTTFLVERWSNGTDGRAFALVAWHSPLNVWWEDEPHPS
jgi:hypothetical protein